ncbi:glycosyltransferase family 2 protein [Anabaena aphanizomenioides LEGE 00250]|uniref:Glycosyltransferase family 2 protein n=1 Tax=Sphaerospermopsis aphanizomenoides LEGE 00250 TaxID=2777972 RepID=A0ABR9VI85_9CYAN|nr:glycosyltransferase family 2 protein [Sphaerospermopsis aphanizomenoides]MBE9238207.1 glycosyltransferase family 2 protein [Sphaerospermopsis aphanizomenoides LEGE 00250]
MHLSIVTTLYYSAPYITEFYRRISVEALKLTKDYEIIFVNDGSPDDSLDIAVKLHREDQRVRVVDLSRNFGHHKAMMTGLSYARGDIIFLLDSDLEEEPELLSLFFEHYQSSDVDVVYGVQKVRKGNFFEKITGDIFYKLFNLISSYPVPANLITARLMSQRYVKALVEHKEREIFLAGIWAITGFEQIPLIVKKHCKGTSNYNFFRKLSIVINSITSFSNKPLIFVFYLGTVISITSGIAAIILIIRRVFFNILLAGWPSLIVSIWLLGGLTIFCMGIIGIYLAKVFSETKQRPYTIVRNVYESEKISIQG